VHSSLETTVSRSQHHANPALYRTAAAIAHLVVCAQCSLKVCHKSATENRDEVDRYVGQFHTGRTFACFYNAETLDHAIGHKVYTRSDVIHCLLWPLLVIAVCVGIFLLVELSSRGLVQLPCGTKDKRSVAAHHAAASPPPPAAASSNTVSPH